MRNIKASVEGDELVLRIDISPAALKAATPSASGKTFLVASSGGAQPVASKNADVSFSLNVMLKR